jgi:hypothetical protein
MYPFQRAPEIDLSLSSSLAEEKRKEFVVKHNSRLYNTMTMYLEVVGEAVLGELAA